MPDTGTQPDHQHIADHLIHIAHFGTAKREIDIFLKPVAEGNVPSAPEFPDRLGNIRIIEVFLKFKAKHQPQTDRHIGIAREIEKNLERIRKGSEPRKRDRTAAVCIGIKNMIGDDREIVGEQHFFPESGKKTADTDGKFIPGLLPV